MKCDRQDINSKQCNCSNEGCVRKGNCCTCVVYHRQRMELPACYFSEEQERTYDRSISYFIKCQMSK